MACQVPAKLFVNRKRKDVRDGGHDRVAERLQARDAVNGVRHKLGIRPVTCLPVF